VALKSMVPSSGCSNPNMSPGNIPLMEVTYPYKPLIGASVNVGGSDKHPKTVTITTFHMACGPSSDKVDYKGSKTGVGYTFTLTGI
jgi:hypothetical protein